MHKAISTKVQGKTSFETKTQQSQTSFLIFYFYVLFGFLTHKKIDTTKLKIFTGKQNNQPTAKKTTKINKQTKSQSIGSINAWTCCNAYA